MSMSEDDERALFEQLQNEQTRAGLTHIAATTADFRDALVERGFSAKQAFTMARDMLACLMEAIPFGTQEDE